MTFEEIIEECGKDIDQPQYPSHSNAAVTQMLTLCKKCGKPNSNGYQYCAQCHTKHKRSGQLQRRQRPGQRRR
jgi:hypothetical protein